MGKHDYRHEAAVTIAESIRKCQELTETTDISAEGKRWDFEAGAAANFSIFAEIEGISMMKIALAGFFEQAVRKYTNIAESLSASDGMAAFKLVTPTVALDIIKKNLSELHSVIETVEGVSEALVLLPVEEARIYAAKEYIRYNPDTKTYEFKAVDKNGKLIDTKLRLMQLLNKKQLTAQERDAIMAIIDYALLNEDGTIIEENLEIFLTSLYSNKIHTGVIKNEFTIYGGLDDDTYSVDIDYYVRFLPSSNRLFLILDLIKRKESADGSHRFLYHVIISYLEKNSKMEFVKLSRREYGIDQQTYNKIIENTTDYAKSQYGEMGEIGIKVKYHPPSDTVYDKLGYYEISADIDGKGELQNKFIMMYYEHGDSPSNTNEAYNEIMDNSLKGIENEILIFTEKYKKNPWKEVFGDILGEGVDFVIGEIPYIGKGYSITKFIAGLVIKKEQIKQSNKEIDKEQVKIIDAFIEYYSIQKEKAINALSGGYGDIVVMRDENGVVIDTDMVNVRYDESVFPKWWEEYQSALSENGTAWNKDTPGSFADLSEEEQDEMIMWYLYTKT